MNRAILIAVALLAAVWLVVGMMPKAVRLVDAHSECGTWTGHCTYEQTHRRDKCAHLPDEFRARLGSRCFD
jgi:hypothetical protein